MSNVNSSNESIEDDVVNVPVWKKRNVIWDESDEDYDKETCKNSLETKENDHSKIIEEVEEADDFPKGRCRRKLRWQESDDDESNDKCFSNNEPDEGTKQLEYDIDYDNTDFKEETTHMNDDDDATVCCENEKRIFKDDIGMCYRLILQQMFFINQY